MKKSVFGIFFLVCITIGLVAAGRQEGRAFPSRPVTIIVPFDVGGGTDTLARAVVGAMSGHFPQTMVVINRPGGGGVVGTMEALNARPDGYTILIAGWGTFVAMTHLTEMPFTEDDYIPILRLDSMPRILSGHPNVPFSDINEMVEYARRNPMGIRVGVTAIGTTDHLAFVELEYIHNVRFNIIPQGGGGPKIVALLGGHIDVAAPNLLEVGPLVEANQVKTLGMMDAQRHPSFPDIRTGAEYGIPIESATETYVFAARGTPPEIIYMLQETFRQVLGDPSFIETARRLNIHPAFLDSTDATRRLDEFRARYGEVIRAMGIGAN